MPTIFQRLCSCVLILAATMVAGCNDGGIKRITVKGTVTFNGAPVTSGLHQFHGAGSYSANRINADGTYIMTEVVPGETKIAIMSTPDSSGSSSGGGGGPKVAQVNLPEKFRDPEKSGMKYTITENMRELNIELK